MIDTALLLGAGVAAAVLVGAVLQHLSGTGLALVSAPLLTLLLGPAAGVLLVNICSICSAALIFGVVRRDVDWRRYRMLTAAAILGVLPGAVLVAAVSASWLALVVGVSIDTVGSRWVFVINVPVGILAFVLAVVWLD